VILSLQAQTVEHVWKAAPESYSHELVNVLFELTLWRIHNLTERGIADAMADLGQPDEIGKAFTGFQRQLYEATIWNRSKPNSCAAVEATSGNSSSEPLLSLERLFSCLTTTQVVLHLSFTMPTPRIHRMGDLQHRILQFLWSRPEASVADVHGALGTDSHAYTTLATLLRRMEEKGLVGHRNEGRTYIYQAIVQPEQVNQGMTGHLLERLFQGSVSELVSHLLKDRKVSAKELARLEKLIADKKKDL
jgi:BlaI family transcriptional regulator, penicillinase repressor